MIDIYIHVVNLDWYYYDSRTDGVWLPLPFTKEQLNEMYRCVTGNISNTPLCIKESESRKLDVVVNPLADIFELNAIAKRLTRLGKREFVKLAAIVEMNNWSRGKMQDFANIMEDLSVIDKYKFFAGVQNSAGLKKHFPYGMPNAAIYTSYGALVPKY